MKYYLRLLKTKIRYFYRNYSTIIDKTQRLYTMKDKNMATKEKKPRSLKDKIEKPSSSKSITSSNGDIPYEPIYSRKQVREKFKNLPLSAKARRIIESLYGIEDKNSIQQTN